MAAARPAAKVAAAATPTTPVDSKVRPNVAPASSPSSPTPSVPSATSSPATAAAPPVESATGQQPALLPQPPIEELTRTMFDKLGLYLTGEIHGQIKGFLADFLR